MTQEEYMALYKKMLTDDEFLTKVDTLKTKEEIYETYKAYGYTDMNYDDFMKEFSGRINGIMAAYREKAQKSRQLSDEELDEIVGGFEWFNFITGIVALIPAVGPILSGGLKGIHDLVDGKTKKSAAELMAGFAGSLLDMVVPELGHTVAMAIGGVVSSAAKLTANTLIDEFM